MEEFTIYCTPEQTRKALKFGAQIRIVSSVLHSSNIKTVSVSNGFAIIPTAEQMINWLRIKHKVFCNVIDEYSHGSENFIYYIEVNKGHNDIYRSWRECELSHYKAVMCVINLALGYLSNK